MTAEPIKAFLEASKAYSDALNAYRDSRDDATIDAAKVAHKAAEKALREFRAAG